MQHVCSLRENIAIGNRLKPRSRSRFVIKVQKIPLLAFLASGCLLLAAVHQQARGQAPLDDTGVIVERLRLPRPSTARQDGQRVGNQELTLVRVDPRRYRVRFFSEGFEGERRPLPAWVRDFNLVGGINAGMFLPNGRSCGYMRQGEEVRSNRTPGRFEAVIGFGQGDVPSAIGIGGNQCAPQNRLAAFQRRYDSVLQARGMLLDCNGRANPWPNRSRYSAAAVGMDERGWVVMLHSRTPYRMATFSRMLESMNDSMDLGLLGLAYMEGGPEASLVVRRRHEGQTITEDRVAEIGSWEDGFYPSDDNDEFWDLPNIIGFEPR